MEDNDPMWDIMVPYPLIEALNGILWVSLVWMLVFGGMHFLRLWGETRPRYTGRGGFMRTADRIYQTAKPEIALMTFLLFLCIRTAVLWYLRYCKDHNFEPHNFITAHGPAILVSCTGMMIVGSACWIRVISPYDGRSAVFVWIAMVSSALLFGILMAVY